MQLNNKVALVTGAASGIGKAIATRFAKEGAAVMLADRDIKGARALADALQAEGGLQVLAQAMDVTCEAQVDAGTQAAIDAFGGLDILVANAGMQKIEPLDTLSFADWKNLLSVHLDGAFLTTRAALRHMYASGEGGCILYMGSVHSKVASALKAPYVTAKHGLAGLCRAVAREGAPHGVRANLICPGFVRTPLVDAQIPLQARELGISEEAVIKNVMLKDTVDGEFTTLQDVADTALFFAAFGTLALTGQSLVVSHGWHME